MTRPLIPRHSLTESIGCALIWLAVSACPFIIIAWSVK